MKGQVNTIVKKTNLIDFLCACHFTKIVDVFGPAYFYFNIFSRLELPLYSMFVWNWIQDTLTSLGKK